MALTKISLKRLGLCIGAVILLIIYSNIAVINRLDFYIPIGMVLMAIYVYLVMTRFKSVYPTLSRPAGQLCLTFLIIGLNANLQKNRIMEKIQENPDLLDAWAFEYGLKHAISSISSMMVVFLFFAYLYFKFGKKKSLQL